jgi:hypothetical protein
LQQRVCLAEFNVESQVSHAGNVYHFWEIQFLFIYCIVDITVHVRSIQICFLLSVHVRVCIQLQCKSIQKIPCIVSFFCLSLTCLFTVQYLQYCKLPSPPPQNLFLSAMVDIFSLALHIGATSF